MFSHNRKNLVSLFESKSGDRSGDAVRRGTNSMLDLLRQKELKLSDLSINALFEATVYDDKGRQCGKEVLDEFKHGMDSRQLSLLETRGAVDTAAFANITGPYVYTTIKEAYEAPKFIGDNFFTVKNTPHVDGEKIPGVGNLGDIVQVVKEGEAAPYVGTNEEWQITPATEKREAIIGLTREIIMADQTHLVVDRCSKVGDAFGFNKEKRQIDQVIGTTNTYNRNGTSYNTFNTSGAFINNQVNALTDWTSLDKARLLFASVKDPNTGEPIMVPWTVVCVPLALEWTMQRILHATEVDHVDNTASPTTIRTKSPNPITVRPTIISSEYIDLRSNTSTWFAGDPKKAFTYMVNWAMEVLQAAQNSEAEFERGIVVRHKVSERSRCHTEEPRYWQKNTAS